ncbi:MAG: tetratricopeptide repeat protein [Clostridium sp.]
MNYFNEGNKLYNTKQYDKAIDLYKKSIDLNENEACSYYNAGVCFLKLKDYDNAIDMIKKAIRLQCESKYFFNLAYCYAMKEDTNKALVYFNLAWSIDEYDEECEKAINLILSKLKKAL